MPQEEEPASQRSFKSTSSLHTHLRHQAPQASAVPVRRLVLSTPRIQGSRTLPPHHPCGHRRAKHEGRCIRCALPCLGLLSPCLRPRQEQLRGGGEGHGQGP